MPHATAHESVAAAMSAINRACLDKRPEHLSPLFHPDLVMVFPGFEGQAVGREAVVAGFVDFCSNATVREYREDDLRIDVTGDIVPPAVTSGCSLVIPAPGSPSGGRCSTRTNAPPDLELHVLATGAGCPTPSAVL